MSPVAIQPMKKNHLNKTLLLTLITSFALFNVTVASAAQLLTFGYQTEAPNPNSNTTTLYHPDTFLTGGNPAATITRPSEGAVNYNSDGWSGGSGNTMALAGGNPSNFTLGFDATGFTDFSIAFGYINESVTNYNYSSIQYRVGGFGGFTTINGAPLTLIASNSGSGTGFTYSLDLSSLSAINNVSNVEIFFNGTTNVGNTLKIDNFVLNGSAVPEPSTWVGAGLITGLAL